jgi:3-phenylpropionate/trans-cinnamate dioxygenase ferredoxin component
MTGSREPTRSENQWLPVCSLGRVRAEGIVVVHIGGVDLLLISDEGRVVACERACPHEQADLAGGHVAQGRLFCPRHAASFELRDGRMSPGWPSRDLRLYPARIERGEILIEAAALARK